MRPGVRSTGGEKGHVGIGIGIVSSCPVLSSDLCLLPPDWLCQSPPPRQTERGRHCPGCSRRWKGPAASKGIPRGLAMRQAQDWLRKGPTVSFQPRGLIRVGCGVFGEIRFSAKIEIQTNRLSSSSELRCAWREACSLDLVAP